MDKMPENGSDAKQANGTDTLGDLKNASHEPTERDLCMGDENDVKIKGQPNIFEKYVREVSDRSGLNRKGVLIVGGIVVAACALLIVVVALAAAWPRLEHKYRYPVCREAACLRAAAQINENLNATFTPCQDLWNSMCGGWLKKHPLPNDRSIWNQKEQLARREAERIRDLVTTLPLPLHTLTVEWKLKHLYEACLDVDNVNTDDARPLINIISELGGWHILRDWNDVEFDKDILLTQLHVKYGVSPFFKISVEPNPHTPGVNSIRISPSGLGLPDKEYYFRDEDDRVQVAYKEYIRDIIIYLSTARNEATKFGTDIFSYEKRIAEITPDLISVQDPISTYNARSISELKQTYNMLPFHDILQAMYPDSNISENTEVIVTSLEYLSQIGQIISSTDRRTMNGYLIWTLVRNYIPYLSDKYTSAMDSFNSELFGTRKPLKRWETCAKIVQKYMGLATEVLLEKSNPISQKSIKVVNGTFNSILNVVRNRLKTFDSTTLLYSHLKSKLSSIKLQIGVPEEARQDAYLKSHYLKLKILKSNLFESAKNGIIFEKKLEDKLLTSPLPEMEMIKNALKYPPKVVYSPSDNTVVVPRSLLTEPIFESNFPNSILYGRLGVELAQAIVSSVLPYDALWTSDKKLLSPFHSTVGQSLKTVSSTAKCLSDYILNLNLAVPYATANETAVRTLKHLSAVGVANEALISTLAADNHIHQPSLEHFEDSSLFFLSYSQSQCSESTSQYQLFENMVNFELPQRSVLHLAWAQIPQFPQSFDCSFNKNVQCRDIL